MNRHSCLVHWYVDKQMPWALAFSCRGSRGHAKQKLKGKWPFRDSSVWQRPLCNYTQPQSTQSQCSPANIWTTFQIFTGFYRLPSHMDKRCSSSKDYTLLVYKVFMSIWIKSSSTFSLSLQCFDKWSDIEVSTLRFLLGGKQGAEDICFSSPG